MTAGSAFKLPHLPRNMSVSLSDSNLSQYLVTLDEPLLKNNETGRGCYGVVYKSRLNGAKCVVKKLHDILTGSAGQETVSETQWSSVVEKFRQEIELLSKQRHPNIVQFLGVCGLDGDPRDISLVMEQLDEDLTGFIETNKGSISMCMKLSILRDIACGVSHLHSTGIVHRDLNSGNVLLTSSLHAKVADLGVSRIIDSRPQYLSGLTLVPGAIDYMPPEALRANPVYGPKLDCFSFGHLALYLAIEVYPRPTELSENELDLRTGKDGQLLFSLQVQKRKQWIQSLQGDSHPLSELIHLCLSDQQRPDMERLRNMLEDKMKNNDLPQLMDLLKERKEFEDNIAQLNDMVQEKDGIIMELQKNIEEKDQHITLLNERIEEKERRIREFKTDHLESVSKIPLRRLFLPDYSTQKFEIKPLLSQKLKKGDEWYMVDQRWLKQWKKYTGFDSWDQYHAGSETVCPGPVNNSKLFNDANSEILKDHIMEELDYALLHKTAWEKLVSWYWLSPGSGPICRHVVEYGTYVKHLKVEVYLFNLKVCVYPNISNTKKALFSRANTVEFVQGKIRQMFDVSIDSEVRLWQRYMTNSYELMKDLDQSLVDSGIYDGQLLMLEVKDKDGKWPKSKSEEK